MRFVPGIRGKISLLLALCFFLGHSSRLQAGTLIHGAKAAGMGGAFAAIADDPSAVLFNPAGLATLKGANFYSGATAIFGPTEFTRRDGETESTEFQVFFPPHFYISSDLKHEGTALGLGIYSPFGVGGRKWDDEGITRYAGTENLITTFAVNPVFAYRVYPWLSVGLGAFYLYSSSDSKQMIDQSALGAGDAKFSIEGSGGGFGFNVGILLFPEEQFSFGLTYRSGVHVNQDVTVDIEDIAPALQIFSAGPDFSTDANTTLDFPQVLSFGAAYSPIKSLTFGLELEWTGWSSFDYMDLNLEEELPEAGLSDFVVDFDYNDVWFVKVGAEYKLDDHYALRGGYMYSMNPVPTSTLAPGNPDSNQHNICVGMGYKLKEWAVDFVYVADFYEDRSVDNDILSGKYENFVNCIGLSVGYSF